MRRQTGCQARQAGFSLPELMIAMTLGLVMLGALVALFSTSLQVSSQSNSSAQMTEEGGLALEFLARYVRMAGYSPPLFNVSGAMVLVNGIQTQAQESDFSGAGVRGCDNGFADPGADFTSLSCNTSSGKAAIALRFQGDLGNTEPSALNLPTDCLAQAISNRVPSALNNLGRPDFTLVESRFTINNNAELVCGGNGNNFVAQPLFGNIEGISLRYGLASDARATQVLRYVDATTVDTMALDDGSPASPDQRWARVISVRICLLVRASAPDQTQPVPYVDCNEQTVSPNDNYLRRAMSTTVTLRNHTALFQ